MTEFTELWPGGPRFLQADGTFPLGTDSVLLADFANTAGVKKACDLGSGTGALSVLLLAGTPALALDGIELRPDAAERCRENLAANGWNASGIITGDLRDHRKLFKAGAYDLVVCNPPYFPAGSGRTPNDPARADARSETACTITEICAAAAFLCRNGGAFSLVHRPERLAEVLCAMSGAGLQPKRLRFVSHKAESAPSLVLIEGRRNARPGLAVAAPLILCKPDGSDSDEIARIYHFS
jgi:tRNA1Val (adenine37-N6)-methyltransferase